MRKQLPLPSKTSASVLSTELDQPPAQHLFSDARYVERCYAACTLQLDFLVRKLTGTDLLIRGRTLSAALWVVVAGVALVNGAQLFGNLFLAE